MKTTMVLALLLLSFSSLALEKAQILDVRGISNLVDGPSGMNVTPVNYPEYSEMEARLSALAQRHSARAAFISYGRTVGGASLNVMRIALGGPFRSERPAVQISGVIHGNEYLGIEDRLIEHFLNNTASMPGLTAFLNRGGIVYFIPVVNPDGFNRRRRLNNNGADLNRDFDLIPRNDMRFTQPETRALADYLERDMAASTARLKLSLDYHCCVPALITPWSYIDAQPETKDQSAFHTIGSWSDSILGFPYGNAMQTVNYLAEGSSIDYFYAKYGTLALAVEGSWWGEESNLAKHVQFWDTLFKSVSDQTRRL
jgi:carboxypeptidase T